MREDSPEDLGSFGDPRMDKTSVLQSFAEPILGLSSRQRKLIGRTSLRPFYTGTVQHEVTAMPIAGGRAHASPLQDRGSSLRYTPLLPPSLYRRKTSPITIPRSDPLHMS